MQKTKNGQLIYSASDLVNYLQCPSVTAYDIQNLEFPLQKTPDDEYVKILQQKGFEHENAYLNELSQSFPDVIDIASLSKNSNEAARKNTHKALKNGADIIFQAFLSDEDRIGHIDFLRKVDKPSALGAHSYEIIDTKLAKSASPKFIIQLCFYSDLLQLFQEKLPENIHLKLGDGSYQSFRLKEYYAYYLSVLSRFKEFIKKPDSHSPEPCSHCVYCSWLDLCNEKWRQEDHLSQVANIRKDQREKLVQAGVTTLKDLALASPETKVPKLHTNTFDTLQKQAFLQLQKRETEKNYYEILPVEPLSRRAFNRLPEPAEGDLFFDMEGDPLEPGGLEYLFGLYFFEKGMPVFKDFWAHDRQQEKKSFESFIDFVWDHLNKYPLAHIYHYAHYEESALKKLMSLHGTREWQVDELLRHNKLVDLYKVVKEGIMISEAGYSIKNLETFYMEARQSEVVNAVGSIIYYEKWKLTGDKGALELIRKYNEDDCRSTFLLYEWLLSIRPESIGYLEENEMGKAGSPEKF
ncbi:MAG: TM0106 family RecB-like putative nuclease, partial [Bacteroidota bacterium]|nr:TM0106 family RecB-like putative nuclease [Bacteroidota bacterium]